MSKEIHELFVPIWPDATANVKNVLMSSRIYQFLLKLPPVGPPPHHKKKEKSELEY